MVLMKALFLLAALGSTSPAAAADLDTLLARQVTPGSVALLLPHLDHPDARKRLLEGLSHADPQVRAASARVAFVRGLSGTAPLMKELAARETEPAVAIEQLRALAVFGADDDRWLLTQALRTGVFAWFLPDLARQRGAAVLPLIKELGSQATHPFRIPFAEATRQGRRDLAIALSVAEGNAADWEEFLLAVAHGRDKEPVPEASLASAIRSSDPGIRRTTYWFLALQGAAKEPVFGAIVGQALDAAADRRPGSDASLAFALDLADRARGRKPARDWSHDMPKPGLVLPDLVGEPLLELLSKKERQALARETRGREDGLDPSDDDSHPATLSRALVRASGFPPGMVASMLATSGCEPARVKPLIAEVEYRPDGRASRIGILTGATDGDACAEVQRAAVALSLAPFREEEKPFLLMTLFDPESLRCLDEVAPRPPMDPGEDVTIYPPKTTHRVPPRFPSTLPRSAHGVVTVSARLAPSGCVQAIEVTKSAGAAFDMSAMQAVSQWRYEPTVVNGKNIPIVMRIAVRFGDSKARFPRR
jgi:TonB family protein